MLRKLCVSGRHRHRAASHFMLRLILVGAGTLAAGCAAAEGIKVGAVRSTTGAPLYIAQERGYFVDEGIPAELIYFESSEPIAVAAAADSVDFGFTTPTAGLYSLAGQGALRIIAGGAREAPGFHFFAYLASSRAYQSGLKSLTDLPGHSVALAQIGSPQHYILGLLADKDRFDLKTLRLQSVQSPRNALSAVVSGQADATVRSMAPSIPELIQRGDIKLLGWAGDETPSQLAVGFAATKTADQRSDTVARFLRAFRKGARDYHDAFTGAEETRQDGPTASAVWAIIAKYVGLSAADVKLGVPYIDADGQLDVKDILHQIAWYKSQGMVKPEVDGSKIIDKHFVVPVAAQ